MSDPNLPNGSVDPAAAGGVRPPRPPQPPSTAAPAAPVAGSWSTTPVQPVLTDPSRRDSNLTDGEWHRMHPLTPLLQGGIVLIVVFGVIISRSQEQLINIFVPRPDDMPKDVTFNGDPIDWVFANNLLLVALAVIAGVLLIFILGFYLSWRVHKFRITDANVEVMKGILFRSQRRAPLDRVQGVNLTRPFIARLIGLAKLEVVGAGNDANVPLEYLTTQNAEQVRADILRLASGARIAREARQAGVTTEQHRQHLLDTVGAGITGLISGAEAPVEEPESVVQIPTGRLVGSTLLSTQMFGLIVLTIVIVLFSIFSQPWALLSMIPAILGLGGWIVSNLLKSLRYSIAPTRDGVRITFGLMTTVTEILPPGRIHALSVAQSFAWRPFGWYKIRLIRMSGKNTSAGQVDQFTTVLPVGKRADVEKVLALLMPDIAASDWHYAFEHGMLGPAARDPFTVTPKRAWFIRPLSFKRNGYLLHPLALLLRRGQLWRSLGIFPTARAQSVKMSQGPVDRLARVGSLQIHTVPGQFNGILAAVDTQNLMKVWRETESAMLIAAQQDHTHRWAGESSTQAADPSEPSASVTQTPGAQAPDGSPAPGTQELDGSPAPGAQEPDGSPATDGETA